MKSGIRKQIDPAGIAGMSLEYVERHVGAEATPPLQPKADLGSNGKSLLPVDAAPNSPAASHLSPMYTCPEKGSTNSSPAPAPMPLRGAVVNSSCHTGTAAKRSFRALLEGYRCPPGGRIFAGAVGSRQVTLVNCFATGLVAASLPGIDEPCSALRPAQGADNSARTIASAR